MNKLTQEIAAWLDVTLEVAAEVQYRMECYGIDFSGSSERVLKREAKSAYADIMFAY
jgi:hypothetical protein